MGAAHSFDKNDIQIIHYYDVAFILYSVHAYMCSSDYIQKILLDGWRCFSQTRVMSRLIQVRQHHTNGYKQIYVRKQISLRCNRIEHWVHLRCAGIRQAQYTDTWTCHLHRESRLAPHTDITPPHPSRPWSKPPTHLHHRNQNTGPTLPMFPQDWQSPNPILSTSSQIQLTHSTN